MRLTLKERLVIMTILPKEGNYVKMTIKSDIISKIKISQEDITSLDVVEKENGSIQWDGTKDTEKEFDLTELEEKMIKDELKKLDDAEKLNDETLVIFKKFN